jgi:hypothetical protein
MRHAVQWLGIGSLCLFAWTMVGQEGPAALSASAEFSSFQRFVVLLDGAAVTDVQTGFIWEQSPDFFYGAWAEAIAHCQAKTVGGRRGGGYRRSRNSQV